MGKEYKYFIDPLAAQLRVTRITSKRLLAAIVWNTLKYSPRVRFDKNYKAVRNKIKSGLCTDYEFCIFEELMYGKLADVLCKYEKHINRDNLYRDYIIPFISNREIIPGVKFIL